MKLESPFTAGSCNRSNRVWGSVRPSIYPEAAGRQALTFSFFAISWENSVFSESGLGGLELQSKLWPARPVLQKKSRNRQKFLIELRFLPLFGESKKRSAFFSKQKNFIIFFLFFRGAYYHFKNVFMIRI